jgi:uncharacterized protein YecT (DUF1311 family)
LGSGKEKTVLYRVKKFIRRHKQSISLLVIAGVLLLIAFYISQLIRPADEQPRLPATPISENATQDDLPACEDAAPGEEQMLCHSETVRITEALLMAEVDDILSQEPDAERRIAFMDTQITWEDSRDADCGFVSAGIDDDWDAFLQELICLKSYNLARLDQLEHFRCEWYPSENCEENADTRD